MTSFTISSNSTSGRTLKSGETGTINSGVTLNPSGVAITWDLTGSAGTATIVNNGTLASTGGRTIDSNGSASSAQSLSITNAAGATMTANSDLIRIGSTLKGGSVTINNSGMMAGGSTRGINLQEYSQLGGFTYTGAAGSTFQSTGDVIRITSGTAGLAFTGTVAIDNAGTIKSTGTGGNNGQALDLADIAKTAAGNFTVTNRATGLIQAADADAVRTGNYAVIENYGKIEAKFASGTGNASGNDGIDGQSNVGVTINNYQGGQILGARHGITGAMTIAITNDGVITGVQGAGINLDTASNTTTTIVNNANGVITGNATSTTDGDAVDVDGLVNLTNHGTIQALGNLTNGTGLNEALAIGGGTVINDGTIISAQRAITVDDSDLGAAFAALNLTNSGTITGNNGSAIAITGSLADSITNSGVISGTISTDGGNDTLTNSGTINGAVTLGAGNDTANWNSLVRGSVDGGIGTDSLVFNGSFNASSGSASFTGFETVSGTLTGTAGNDVLDLSALSVTGSLTINGGDGNDTITGGSEADTITGGTGADTLRGSAGNDVINGGDGSDTAIFSGSLASYSIMRNGSTYTVTGADGTDTVTNVENFQFASGTVASDQVGNVGPALTGAAATLAHATEDQTYTVSKAQLLAGFTDGNGDTLNVAGLSASNGAVVDNLNGTYTVTPGANFNGAATLSYSVTDGYGGATAAQLGYVVDAVNDAPALTGSQAVLPHGVEDAPFTVSAAQLLQGFSDVDGDTLSIANLSANAGFVTDNLDGTYTISHAPNLNGTLALSYTVTDGHGGESQASLSYVVDPENDAPTLTGLPVQLANGSEDVAYTVSDSDLLFGYSDADGDQLSVTNFAATAGRVINNFDGTYTITPAPDFNGNVFLFYQITDGQGGVTSVSKSFAFNPVNDAPVLTGAPAILPHVAEDMLYTVSASDLLSGFTDPDGDPLQVGNLAASNGTVTDNHDGTYTIQHQPNFNGAVTLSYDVGDSHGGVTQASLGYVVDPVNDAPTGTPSYDFGSYSEDTSVTFSAQSLLAGLVDADGDTLTISSFDTPGLVLTDNLDGTYTLTPPLNANGPFNLTYTVSDGHGGQVVVPAAILFDPVNDAPVLTGTPATLAHGTEDVAYTVSAADLLVGFTDVDLDTLSVTGISASNGNVVDNLNGTYTITPTADFFGNVTLSYTVSDGHGGNVAAQLGYIVNDVVDVSEIVGTEGNDVLVGTKFDDILRGLGGDDVLTGLIYNDLLDGGQGSDTASYAGATKGVTVDLAITTAQNTNGAGIDTLVSIENLLGSGLADRLYGDDGANVIDGGRSGDKLYGRGGDDTLIGGLGNDMLDGGDGDDLLDGGDSGDQLFGGAGRDHLLGGAGIDTLDGGTGADLMEGGAGGDKYYVDNIGDQIIEAAGGGTDIVYASIDFTLGDNLEKLSLTGFADINATGNALNNIITGNAGDNVINGGRGRDTLIGGLGADTFLFDTIETTANKDTIKDFVTGTDRIALSASAFSALAGYGLGELSVNELTFGTRATTADQHLIYNERTGGLFYDADGVGGAAQVQIALLSQHATLLVSDIIIV